MKRLILFLIFSISVVSFSDVNDKIGFLKDDEKTQVEAKVEEASESTGLNFHVNYVGSDETTQLKEEEKSVIINLVKADGNTLKVRVNFTQDIQIEEYKEEIEGTLDNLEDFIEKGQNLQYSLELIGNVEEVIKKSQSLQKTETEEFKEKGNNKSKFFILILLIGGVFLYRRKMKK